MRVAVLSLLRDRLEYTEHCFGRLQELAGCEFDHVVLDQASTDGTHRWIAEQYVSGYIDSMVVVPENIGITRGMNTLLDLVEGYDVIVKFDNDCELLQPNTLRDVCELSLAGNALLSPRILGLRNPPQAQGEFDIAGESIIDIPQIGGIFLAAPAWVYSEFRYDEEGPTWGIDDVSICRWFRQGGGRCGYVKRLEANHYETTDGQWARFPEYFERTLAEGKPSL